MRSDRCRIRLNGICPYFTMFPLDFPYGILARHGKPGETVLDPFCGRGTTNFAARLLGLSSVGVDASPVATAIAAAKLVSPNVKEILAEARAILATTSPLPVPKGEFWELAYHPRVLQQLCRLRAALLDDCADPVRIALRAILLGALHGPKRKTIPAYLSNQAPRTYAPKPAYAVRYWRSRGELPPDVDVLGVIERRAHRFYGTTPPVIAGEVRQADSRRPDSVKPIRTGHKFDWVITSPPYYGMRTYIPDQWLRHWFVGGPDTVSYAAPDQIGHSSPEEFAANLRQVWCNVRAVAAPTARMVVRFGGVSQRKADPREILKASLHNSGWRIVTIRPAGSARHGYRQADAFLKRPPAPVDEFDVWAACR